VDPTYTPYDPAIHTSSTHPPLRVLYGSFHPTSTFAILYKPSNLSVSSFPPADSVERRLREGWAGVRGRRRVWFPHRLDKHTEGVMVVVFDGMLNARMGREIAEKRWTKRYRLIGQLPHSLPPHRLPPDEEGAEESREARQSESERKGKGNETHVKRLWKLRCSYLKGELFTPSGLLSSGLLSSHLARRPPPPPAATVDFDAEEQRWSTDLTTTPTLTSPSTSTHSPHRRIHPFVPETMLYYSVAAGRGVEGAREAVTKYRLLDVDGAGRQAMWEAELLTGRSHQLRVHWSDAGCPIVNDPYYNHRYVWQQVQQEKARRARLAAGEVEQKTTQVEAVGEEQQEERLDRPVVLVTKVQEAPRQSFVDDEEEKEEDGQAAEDGELHASDADRPTAARSPSSAATTHRPPPSRLTPLGPSYRILPPAQSRAFSTQWQSVLDKYGVKSAVDSGSRRGLKGERGVLDDVESMAELREAEEEDTIRQMVEARRQRKENRQNKQRGVEELDVDDILAMEEDEVELYPTNTTTHSRPSRPTPSLPHNTRTPLTHPHTTTPSNPTDSPLASAGWLAMSSPTTRSPFAATHHGMRLQSYYLCMPHPTRAGYELTVVVPLPSEWTSGGQRWEAAEVEWQKWQWREQRQTSLGRYRWLGREKRRAARGERNGADVQSDA